jgi:hypothetical protein
MGLTGNLKTVSFPDVLQLLATGKKSGVLTLSVGSRKKEIAFKDGNITYASSINATEDLLGNLLLKRGKISKKDLERAITLHKQTGRALGATLVDMQLFEKEEVADCLKMQIEEIVYNLFSWNEGEFAFAEGKAPQGAQFFVNLSTMNIVMEGTRRVDEWTEIQKVLPPNDVILRVKLLPKINVDEITLSIDEFKILSIVNGERVLPEIITASPIGEFPTCRAMYRLIVGGLVEGAGKKAQDNIGPDEDEEEVILGIVFRLYNSCFLKIRTVIETTVGASNPSYQRFISSFRRGVLVFFPGCDLNSETGPSFEKFMAEVRKIPESVRMHRVLAMLEDMLHEQIEFIFIQFGAGPVRDAISHVKKEISEPLALRRELVKKYYLDENFFDSIRKAERTIKTLTGAS